jgi:deoxyribonuclease IV
MKPTSNRRIGAHLSTSKGIVETVHNAAKIGANCLQVFSGSPRMWRRTPLDRIDAKAVQTAQDALDVKPIFTHALYLVNLASDNPDIITHSLETLKHDLTFDAHLGGAGVVVHIGSHQGRGFAAVKDMLVSRIHEILRDTPTESHFLIENSAGQQGKIGGNLTEVQWLIEQLNSPRVGWCVDTCHAFAAGYAFTDNSSFYQEKDQKESNLFNDENTTQKLPILAEVIQELGLLDSLKVIHVNGSRDPFNSGRDRHANIGEGTIPSTELQAFFNHPAFTAIPLITEVPGIDGQGPDAENITRIKELVK